MKRIKRVIIDFLWTIPVLLVFSTVFIVSLELAQGVVSGKYFWFYGSMGVISITTLIFAAIRKLHFRFTKFDWLILLFSGNILFTSFVINDALQNTTKLVLFALLVVLYFNFRFFFEHKDTNIQRSICFFIVLTGFIEVIWGLRQLYGFSYSQHSLFKLTGSFFNPGPYSGYLAMVFPLALYYAGQKVKSKRVNDKRLMAKGIWRAIHLLPFAFRLMPLITCIAILLVLPAAMSRASWLAVTAGSLLVLCGHYSGRFSYLKDYYEKQKKKILFIGIVVLISLFSALSGMYLLKKDSADGRSLMWKIALQTAQKHPFGVGLGNFSGAYGNAQADYFASGKGTETEEYVAGCPEYGFNEYLQIAIESGVISLVLFIVIVFLSLKSLIVNRKWGVAGSMVSLLIFAFFSYPFSVLPFLIVFVFLLANRHCEERSNPKNRKAGLLPARASQFAMTGICLFLSFFCLYKAYPVYQAYKKWNTNKFYYYAGLYKDVAKDYESLYPFLNDQIQFLFEYAQSLSKSEQYDKSNEVLLRAIQISCDPMLYNIIGKNYQALKEYDRAEICFIKATNITPNRLYPFYLLTKLYHEMGLQNKVNEMASIVETKEPKVHSSAVEEMREEVRKLRIK